MTFLEIRRILPVNFYTDKTVVVIAIYTLTKTHVHQYSPGTRPHTRLGYNE